MAIFYVFFCGPLACLCLVCGSARTLPKTPLPQVLAQREGLFHVLQKKKIIIVCPACCRKHGWALPQQLLSFRTVSTRTTVLQRSSRDGEAMQEYADPQMQAMAQVWAHPEDLPLYPVSPSGILLFT